MIADVANLSFEIQQTLEEVDGPDFIPALQYLVQNHLSNSVVLEKLLPHPKNPIRAVTIACIQASIANEGSDLLKYLIDYLDTDACYEGIYGNNQDISAHQRDLMMIVAEYIQTEELLEKFLAIRNTKVAELAQQALSIRLKSPKLLQLSPEFIQLLLKDTHADKDALNSERKLRIARGLIATGVKNPAVYQALGKILNIETNWRKTAGAQADEATQVRTLQNILGSRKEDLSFLEDSYLLKTTAILCGAAELLATATDPVMALQVLLESEKTDLSELNAQLQESIHKTESPKIKAGYWVLVDGMPFVPEIKKILKDLLLQGNRYWLPVVTYLGELKEKNEPADTNAPCLSHKDWNVPPPLQGDLQALRKDVEAHDPPLGITKPIWYAERLVNILITRLYEQGLSQSQDDQMIAPPENQQPAPTLEQDTPPAGDFNPPLAHQPYNPHGYTR
jgi:hypothetical protein